MSTRDTPTTYSAEEAARIKEMAGRPDASLVCPRCNTPLILLTPTDNQENPCRSEYRNANRRT